MKTWHCALLVLGEAIGFITCEELMNRPCGVLRIDHTNPERDVYRFEIDNIDKLSKKKRIILTVDNKAKLNPQ